MEVAWVEYAVECTVAKICFGNVTIIYTHFVWLLVPLHTHFAKIEGKSTFYKEIVLIFMIILNNGGIV